MNRSETIAELAAALAKAQGQMGSASKSANNPFYKTKYADLAAIVDAVKKPLSDNGIAYVQTTDTDDGMVIVETTLVHSSGEWLSSALRMRPTKDDPQGIGSCITYARRYGLQAIVGLDADDDDGNAASGNAHKTENREEPARPTPAKPEPQIMTADEAQERATLFAQIAADGRYLMLDDAALNKDAKIKDGVARYHDASTGYLRKLAERLATGRKEKEGQP